MSICNINLSVEEKQLINDVVAYIPQIIEDINVVDFLYEVLIQQRVKSTSSNNIHKILKHTEKELNKLANPDQVSPIMEALKDRYNKDKENHSDYQVIPSLQISPGSNRFIEIIDNQKINSNFYNETKAEIISRLIESLHSNSFEYQMTELVQQYLQDLAKYVESSNVLDARTMSSDDYINLINQAYTKVLKNLNILSNTSNSISDTSSNRPHLQILRKIAVLNNFDTLIDRFCGDFVHTTPSLKGKVVFTDKYELTQQGMKVKNFNDADAKADSDQLPTKIFQIMWETIPNGKGGVLTKKDLDYTLMKINKAFNENVNYKELNLKTVLDILSDVNVDIPYKRQIRDWLKRQDASFQNTLNKTTSSTQRGRLHHYFDFTAAFVYQLKTHQNVAYSQVTSFEADVKRPEVHKKDKSSLNGGMENILVKNIVENNNYTFVTFAEYLRIKDQSVFSDDYIRYINKITGLHLNREFIYSLMEKDPDAESIIRNFISEYSVQLGYTKAKLANTSYTNIEDRRKLVKDDLQKVHFTQSYILFSNLIFADNYYSPMKVKDLNGKQQANSTIPNNFQRLHDTIDKNRDLRGNIFVKSGVRQNSRAVSDYLISTEKYNKHCQAAYRQNVKIKDTIVDAEKLTTEENLWLSFNTEFLDSICKYGTIFSQPVCYADKTRIGLVGINAETFLSDFKLKKGTLQNKLKDQRASYYKQLEVDIANRYKEVFSAIIPEVKYIATLSELQDFIAANQSIIQQNLNKLRKDIDYSEYKEGKKTVYRINDIVLTYIKEAYNQAPEVDQLVQDALVQFKEDAKDIEIPTFFKNDYYLKNNEAILRKLFEYDGKWEDFENIILDDSITTWGDLEGKLGDFSILEKYFYIQNLISDAFQQINGLPYTDYGGKQPNGTDTKQWLRKQLSDNAKKGTKRHNFYSATYQAPRTDNPYGVRKKSNYLVVKDLKQSLYNYDGNHHVQEVTDGAIWALGIQTIWEQNSYPEQTFGNTMKVIGLLPDKFNAKQVKCAQYSITNWLLRQSFDDYDPGVMHMRRIADAMFKSGKVSEKFTRAFLKSDVNLTFDCYIKHKTAQDGVERMYQFQGLSLKTDDSGIPITDENGNYWYETSWATADGYTKTIVRPLESAYDIWQLFGGTQSYSMRDGEYYLSESSMEATAYIISEFEPEIKENMISKIIPEAALKTGIENSHTIEQLESGQNLNPIEWDNSYIGIQQDYEHTAEDSEIPTLTQLLNNIAFNGQNVELVNRVWETLEMYIRKSLKKYDYLRGKDLRQLHEQLAKNLIRTLKSQNTTDANLYTIVQEALKGNGLVISDQSIFYKLASDLTSDLNHNSLRSKLRGIAIVQNPSQGVIGVYENKQGNTLMQEDYEKDPFNENLQHEPVDVQTLAIEDIVSIDGGAPIRIANIKDLIDLQKKQKDGATIYKEYGKKRNLKSPTLTYKVMENGEEVTKSWWLAPWTIARYETEKAYREDPTVDNARKAYASKQWYMANLEAIQNNTLYLNEKQFKDGKLTPIIGYTYTGGEQILPKVFKSVFHLTESDSLHDVVSKGPSFFYEKLQPYYKVDEEESAYTGKFSSIRCAFKDFNVYYNHDHSITTGNEIELTEDNTITEDGVRYYTRQGEKLFVVPNYCKSIRVDGNNYMVNRIPDHDFIFLPNLEYNDDCISALVIEDNQIVPAIKLSKDTKQALNKLNPFNYNEIKNDSSIRSLLNHLATVKFKSFNDTLETVSVRIPTQAFQSFMQNKTVGFIDADTNDGYINVMQIWFTGGDYDIDKSYTLMYDVDGNGFVKTTSNLYNEGLSINKCFDLPLPNNKKVVEVILPEEAGDNQIANFVLSASGQQLKLLNSLRNLSVGYINPEQSYELIIEGLKLLEEFNGNLVLPLTTEDSQVLKFINILNTHNNTRITDKALKNRLTNGIIRCSGSVGNMHASQQPMDSSYISNLITEVENDFGIEEASNILDVYNPIYKWIIQREAIMGKGDVGISANGIKVGSTLQQYYNSYYQNWDGNSPIDPQYQVNIPLDIVLTEADSEGNEVLTPIIQKHITRFGNTVLDKDSTKALFKFKQLYQDVDVTFEKDYQILERLLDPSNKPKTNQERRILNSYNTITKNASLTRDSYLEWLFKKEKFDVSVADNLSIFISLAVDNMKEMQLSRIFCSEELLKIPLTLIMLGVDPYDTVLFCKKILKPIYNKLSCNRFKTDGKKPYLNEVIKELYNDNESLVKQLQQIVDISDNVTLMSKFLKINQGITATYNDLSLEQIQLVSSLNSELIENVDPDLQQGIDLYRLFALNDKNYQDAVVRNTSNSKGFNLIHVLLNTPHFRVMHEAAQTQIHNLHSVAARAFIQSKLSPTNNKYFKSEQVKHLQYLFDHFIIGKTLQQLDSFVFTKASLKDGLGVSLDKLNIQAYQNFDLTSNEKIDLFVTLMSEYVIPKLKKLYPKNYAIQLLQQTKSYVGDKVVYDIPISKFTQNIEEQENLKKAIADFSLVAHAPSGIINNQGQSISIIDALNVYQMVTKRDSLSSFKDIITENTKEDIDVVARTKNRLIKYYDANVFQHVWNGSILDEDLKKLLEDDDIKSTILGNFSELKDSYVWTFRKKQLSGVSIGGLVDLINKNSVEGVTATQNGNSIIITARGAQDIKEVVNFSSGINLNSKKINEALLAVESVYYKQLKYKNLQETDYSVIEPLLKGSIDDLGIKVKKDTPNILNTIIQNLGLPVNRYYKIIQRNSVYTNSFIEDYNQGSPLQGQSLSLHLRAQDVNHFALAYTFLNYKYKNDLTEQVKALEAMKNASNNSKEKEYFTKFINKYIAYYKNNNIIKQDLQQAQLILQQNEQYINNMDIFYNTDKTVTIDKKSITEGDVIDYKGDLYLFIGNDKEAFKFINLNSGNIEFINLNEYKGYRLLVPYGYYVSTQRPAESVNTFVEPLILSEIPLKSTVEINSELYKIVYQYNDSVIAVDNNGTLHKIPFSTDKYQYKMETSYDNSTATEVYLENLPDKDKYFMQASLGNTVKIKSPDGTINTYIINSITGKKVHVSPVSSSTNAKPLLVNMDDIYSITLSQRSASSEFEWEVDWVEDSEEHYLIDNRFLKYYEVVKIPVYKEGDILCFDSRYGKVTKVQDDVIILETLDSGNKHTIEAYRISDIAQKSVHYTKDRDLIWDNKIEANSKQLALDNTDDYYMLANNFINHLETMGIQVRYTEGETKVVNNIIYVNDNNPQDVLYLTLHELSHLAIANLKVHSKTAYYEMLQVVKSFQNNANTPRYTEIWNGIKDNTKYPTELDKLEEFLVKIIDDILQNSDFINSKEVKSLFAASSDASQLLKYFNKVLDNLKIKDSLQGNQQILNLILDRFNLDSLDIEALVEDGIYNEVMNSIKKVC